MDKKSIPQSIIDEIHDQDLTQKDKIKLLEEIEQYLNSRKERIKRKTGKEPDHLDTRTFLDFSRNTSSKRE